MNIFIAGLNYNMSEAELGELFAEYGEVVSVKIIMAERPVVLRDMVLLKWLMMKLEIKRLQLLMKWTWMEKLFLCQ